MSKRPKVSDRLREAIKASPESLRTIASETGVDVSVLSRFVRGEAGIAIRAVDALADYFQLELRKGR